ncbi:MAG: hypothetical protein SP1CHLAM54_03730 [Chlamydiia bacterium]|nr:hypothetical protein [Chlamydiia bacterium]MCH9615289.1 hypothetical protein [Chlamydiia bacterium]MCH9628389.1 hypothetical protein [Chlamydiia bacterium]
MKKWLAALAVCLTSLVYGNLSYAGCDSKGVPLDHKLLDYIRDQNGVYIEVGANDGVIFSNTKLLEELYGWTGILVEPSECLFTALCQNRPSSHCFNCALGPHEMDNTFVMGDFDGGLMSSVGGERCHKPANQKVLMRSLQSILDETAINHVDFFSLDVEGYELDVLKGIDFDKTTFDWLLIEVYVSELNELVSFLDQRGYECIENFTNFNLVDNPGWDGTHNDYLFKRK